MPWALKISEGPNRVAGTYHPTFLYESLWCVGVAVLVIWADRRFRLGHGRAFALYVASYCAGRAWIEYMRVDEAHHILGVRLNVWTAGIVFVLAVLYMVVSAKVRPGREEIVEPDAVVAEGAEDAGDAEGVDAVKDRDAKDGDAKDGDAKDRDAKDRDAEDGDADGTAKATEKNGAAAAEAAKNG